MVFLFKNFLYKVAEMSQFIIVQVSINVLKNQNDVVFSLLLYFFYVMLKKYHPTKLHSGILNFLKVKALAAKHV